MRKLLTYKLWYIEVSALILLSIVVHTGILEFFFRDMSENVWLECTILMRVVLFI